MKIAAYCTRRAWRILGVMTLLCGGGLWAQAAGGQAAKESAAVKETSKATEAEEPSGAQKTSAAPSRSVEKSRKDRTDSDESGRQIKIFSLQYARAEDLSRTILSIMDPRVSGDAQIACDSRTNRIIVNAPREFNEVVEALLLRLDEPTAAEKKEEKPQGSAWVEVWWIGGEPKGKGILNAEALEALTPKLLDGTSTVAGGVCLLAQTLVTTSTDGRFQVQCSPILENTPVQWSVSGSVKERAKDMAELQVQISVSEGCEAASKAEDPYGGSSTSDNNAALALTKRSAAVAGASGSTPDLLGLNTTITAPYGHDVVLGITATRKMSSVFVIRVKRENR